MGGMIELTKSEGEKIVTGARWSYESPKFHHLLMTIYDPYFL